MKLEVLLSVIDVKEKDLENMNISSNAIIINQCKKNGLSVYKNFRIYSYAERGLANSRNRGLEKIKGDIIVLCDDDMVYNKNYEEIILKEFEKNNEADIIVFNIESPNRKIKLNTRNKRLHFYNILRYTSTRIAFRRKSIENADIRFNTFFGAGAKYTNGEDTLFLVEALRKNLKIYSSTENIGTVYHKQSTWFKGYNKKFFFDKGALFTAIYEKYRFLLILQYLLRHKEVLDQMEFNIALKYMLAGSKHYINWLNDVRK